MEKQFIVIFRVPPLTEELLKQVPRQRKAVDHLMSEGILISYSLTKEMNKLFAIFRAYDVDDLKEHINKLPLTRIMPFQYGNYIFIWAR